MSEFLYEKDLVSMKYAILISKRHDRLVREIAAEIGISRQQLRKYMIDRMDMLLLENLPARYEMGKKEKEFDSAIGRALGRNLYTRFIPLLERDRMNRIMEQVRSRISGGIPEEEAVAAGKRMIGEEILE